MLEGTIYKTPDFYFALIGNKVRRIFSERCAKSWKMRIVEHPTIERPEGSVLGFRTGTVVQDFRSGSLWYILGAFRKEIDYDVWTSEGFTWDDVMTISRAELELHKEQGVLNGH